MRTLIAALAAGLPLCGCGDSPEARETRQEIREAAERTGDYLAERSRALRDEITTELGDMDQRIAELDDRAAEAGAEFRERWQHLSEELSDERAVLRQKLDEWKNASGDAAAEARREVEAAWQDVRGTYRRMREEADAAEPPP